MNVFQFRFHLCYYCLLVPHVTSVEQCWPNDGRVEPVENIWFYGIPNVFPKAFLHCQKVLVPLFILSSTCSFQLSLLSRISPGNFTFSDKISSVPQSLGSFNFFNFLLLVKSINFLTRFTQYNENRVHHRYQSFLIFTYHEYDSVICESIVFTFTCLLFNITSIHVTTVSFTPKCVTALDIDS